MALTTKASKGFREVPIEFQRIIQGNYPAFVTSQTEEALCDEIPVFMFHSVERSTFNEQLDYLKRNGYRTLGLMEFMGFLAGEIDLRTPSVLLTFDDGHRSWYDVAYPLMKSYGFHAVGFLVPSRVLEQPDPAGSSPWLSWPEVWEMEQSGVMEMESHTYRHDRIFIDPQPDDFYNPQSEYRSDPLGLDAPWIGAAEGYTNQLQWGTPIYRHASRFSGHPRLYDDPEVRKAMVAWVARQGGEAFFRRFRWRRELNEVFQTLTAKGVKWQYETEQQQRQAVFEELLSARCLLQEKLQREVRHLCYPWGEGSRLSVALSREAGYASNFWVAPGYRRSNRLGDSPFYIPRLKDDYIFRLPGKGRKTLMEIFQVKLRRRAKKLYLY